MRLFALVVALLAGCLTPDLVPCGDISCPADTVCLQSAQRCATVDEIAACVGMVDGTNCSVDGSFGTCGGGACIPGTCGDGIIGPTEACDGTVPDGVDCTHFGYYRGTVTCTDLCQLSPTGCSGRCGDGVIDAAEGEYCDHVLPDGASCLDFGYDVGQLACGAACGGNLNDCEQLAWARVGQIHDTITDLWGGDGRIGFVADHASVFHDGTVDPSSDGGFSVIAGSATKMWAAGSTAFAMWSAASGWTSSTPPWTSDTTIHDIWASDALGVFVSVDQAPALWHFDGTSWTTVSGAWAASATFGQPEDKLYVLYADDIAVWNGTSWGLLGLAGATKLAVDEFGTLWAFVGNPAGQLLTYDGTSWQDQLYAFQFGYGPGVVSLVPGPGGVYVGEIEGHQYAAQTGTVRLVGTNAMQTNWTMIGTSSSSELLASDGAGTLFSAGGDGLFWIHGVWVDDGPDEYAQSSTYSGGQPVVVLSDSSGPPGPPWVMDIYGGWGWAGDPTDSSMYCIVAERVGGTLYCAANDTLTITTSAPTVVASGNVAAMWVGHDGTVVVVGDHSYLHYADGMAQLTQPAIAFRELGGDSATDLYAIAVGDGDTVARLWHFDGANWSAVTAPLAGDLAQLVIGTTKVRAVMNGVLVTFDRATGELTTSTPPFPLASLTGAGEELFGATNTPNTYPSILWFFNGSSWSPIRQPALLGGVYPGTIQWIKESGEQVMFSINNQLFGSSELYRLVRTGRW